MKLRNKLILSCAALAAVATTAVSTTYAWYTSNTEVNATGITAKTETTGNDTLLISLTGAKGTWGPTVNVNVEQNLVPLAFGKNGDGTSGTGDAATADTNLYAWNAEGDTVATEASAEAGAFIQFSLYFKNQSASVATGIYVKALTIANATETPKAKDILTATNTDGYIGLPGAKADKVSTYTVDLLRATDIYIETKKVAGYANTDDEGYSTASEAASFAKVALLDTEYYHSAATFNDIFDATTNGTTAKTAGQYATSANAHTYYNGVKGSSISTSNPLATSSIAATGTNLNLGTTTAAASGQQGNQDIFEVQFTIFLNGWDLHCYDAVQGQKITMQMAFSTKDTNCVKYATASAK